MSDNPTSTEPAYFGTPEQLLNALTEMQRRETRIQERAILCAALEALIDKPAPAPDKVGYSQAKRDLCLFLNPDLASADAWGWDDDSVFAAALARLTTPALDPDALARWREEAVQAEREACAEAVESLWAYRTCSEVAAAIRARKGGAA